MGIAFKSVLMNAKVSGSKVVVTCDPAFAGKTISCSKDGTTLTQVCPSTSPYTVTFEGLDVGIWTISGIIQGVTFTTTAEVQDVSAVLSYGFVWTTWVDTASQLDSTDYSTLDELLADEEAVRELMLEHACVDYLSSFNSVTPNLEKVIENDLCAKWVNNSDYALDNMYANAAIKTAMDTADKYGYGEWVITDDTTTPVTWGPKGNVPVMTANTAPYGTASAYQVFDRSYSTTASGTDFSYKFTNPVCPKAFICNNASGVSLGGTLQGSNDGSTWTDISTPSSNTDYYLYLRVHHSSSVTAAEVQFYGRSLSVSVPTMTSNTAPYGEASASSENTGAFNAFTDASGSLWTTDTNGHNGSYIGYEFTNPTIILQAIVTNRSDTATTQSIKECKLQYYDGNDWQDASDIVTLPQGGTGVVNANNIHNVKRWRILGISNYGDSRMALSRLQFYGLDYSEKEFEVGTTKKWLYDHGVELETLGVSSQGGQIVTKNADSFIVGSNSGAGFVLDLTPYSLARLQVGREVIESIYSAFMITPSLASYTADAQTRITDMPYNTGLDVSSFNTSKCVMVWTTTDNKAEVTELWLE